MAVCTACGTSRSTSNVFWAAFSFGTRSTYATRAEVSALPWGCMVLTTAWPLANGVRARTAATAPPSPMRILSFIRIGFSLRLSNDVWLPHSVRSICECDLESRPLPLPQHPAGQRDLVRSRVGEGELGARRRRGLEEHLPCRVRDLQDAAAVGPGELARSRLDLREENRSRLTGHRLVVRSHVHGDLDPVVHGGLVRRCDAGAD